MEVKEAPVRSSRSLADSLRGRITQGHWPAGGMLPSRVALAREHGVSLSTVQQAVSHLIGEGVLYADGGRGTFVAQAAQPAAPARPASDRRPLMDSPVLGIVDVTALRIHALRADAYGWIDVIATHLESAFQNVGGLTHCFDPPPGAGDVPPEAAVEALLKEGADALAFIGVFDQPAPDLAGLLDWRRTPAVYVSADEMPGPFPHVFYDNRLAGFEAAEHLRRCGYGPLAFFGRERAPWSEQRQAGAREAAGGEIERVFTLRDAGLTDEAAQRAAVGRAVEQLFSAAPDGPASRWGVIADNDLLAMAWQDAAAEQGRVAGRDYGLVGFDNHPLSRGRGLTTLRPPLEALGEQAARMLLHQLRGDKSGIQARLRSSLLPRTSTRRL